MTWGELLKQGQERLKKAGIQEYARIYMPL